MARAKALLEERAVAKRDFDERDNAAGPPVVLINQAMAKATDHLLNTTYKLTDEQKRKLISEPDVAIPQLAAQMHVQIATQIKIGRAHV